MENKERMLNIIKGCTQEAGTYINKMFYSIDQVKITQKTKNDFVTQVDNKSEEIIVKTIKENFPNHAILAEESGKKPKKNSKYLWVIDPLDGTTNFIQKIPHYGISVALLQNNQPVFGLIHHPLRDETFHAFKDGGSFLNQKKIKVSNKKTLQDCLGATGFPFRTQNQLEAYLRIFKDLFAQSQGMRRCGAAVLDLAYLACGRYDYFWEAYLEPWDFLAGVILIQEAGGIITSFQQKILGVNPSSVIAGHPNIYHQVIKYISNL